MADVDAEGYDPADTNDVPAELAGGELTDPELTDEPGDAEPVDIRAVFLDWVTAHFAGVEYVHTEKRAPWCPEWWQHPEVVSRLWALWQAREQAEVDAGENLSALSDWWLSHWDRHAAILFDSSRGPFRNCDRTLGHLHRVDGVQEPAVPIDLPPDEWQPHP